MIFWATMIFIAVALIVIGLHLLLFMGAPLGDMTMGGRNPGVLPVPARMASLGQATLLLVLCILVLHASGLARLPLLPMGRWGAWVAVVVSAISAVLNTITPSRRERMFGIPATYTLLGSSLVVALGG